MASPETSRSNRERDTADTALREQLGVTPGSFTRYRSDCQAQLSRLRCAKMAVVDRGMRSLVEKVEGTLDAIILNVSQDPDDIREEIALPSVMSRLADTIDEYLRLASTPGHPPQTLERLRDITALTSDGSRWLGRLLERMKANDGDGVLARVQVLSALFRSDEKHRRDGMN
ncbi:MAG: hypothetical protein DCC75_03225 [Proteobacteria bacterium]|nr:MAG: hypothetical protein DCC75_03225 [Pseudomonadota bacterium]